jgi:8-oxo-dGTP pyrophosphatase MutT (NUDIX family)
MIWAERYLSNRRLAGAMVFLKNLAPRDAQLGVGLVVKHGGRLLFAVPEKARCEIDSANKRTTIKITGIGGALGLDEDFLSAARRECIEEISARPEIESGKRTFFVDYDNSIREISLEDEIKPIVVFRRLYLKGTESWQLFVAVYLARLHDKPVPTGSCSALISLTLPELRLLRTPEKLHSFLSAGAHLMDGKEKIPRGASLSTFGTPTILLVIDESRRHNLTNLLKNSG